MFSFAVGSPDRKVFWCISMYVHGIVIGSMRSIAYELHQISMCDGVMVYLNLCVCAHSLSRLLVIWLARLAADLHVWCPAAGLRDEVE